jgi:hypothetical protein
MLFTSLLSVPRQHVEVWDLKREVGVATSGDVA